MATLRIPTGASEVVQVFAADAAGAPLTGKSDLFIRIRRINGDYLDFADDTFKAAGWTTINGLLTESDATNAAGLYNRTFSTASITNKITDDTYTVIPLQTPGTDATLPSPGELKEGDFVDNLDAPISANATLLATIDGNTNSIVADIKAMVIDGTVDLGVVLSRLNSFARGKIILDTITATEKDVEYYAENGTTKLFESKKTAGLRTPQ